MAPSILGLASAILGIPTITTFIQNLISALTRNSEYIENVQCTRNQLQEFEDEDLLDKMSILLTPTAYSDGSLNTVIPPYQVFEERVVNGDFRDGTNNWQGNYNTTLSVSNGQLDIQSISASGKYGVAFSEVNFVEGKKYLIKLDVISTDRPTHIRVGTSSTVTTGTPQDIFASGDIGIGSHEKIYTATGNFTYLSIGGRNDMTTLVIDNVSVREVTVADFHFSRGSSATRVNEQGLVEDVQILSGELVQNGNFEQIGAEEVTNGTFETDSDWTLTNATISNGIANISTSGDLAGIVQSSVTTSGKVYKFNIDITDIETLGQGVSLVSGGLTSTILHTFTTLGTHTVYFKATSTTVGIKRKSGATDISIDNISVKEVGQNWSLNDSAFFTANGVNIKHTPSAGILTSDGYTALVVGRKYRMTYEIVENNAGAVKLGSATDEPMVSTVGTHAKEFIADLADVRIIRDGATVDVTIDNISVVEITDDTDLPRIDYSPYSGAGTCGHILLEPQRTNFVTYSEDFSQWAKIHSPVVTDNFIISPDGTQNAAKVVFSGVNSGRIEKGSSHASTNVTQSIYLKTESGTQAVSIGAISNNLKEVTVTNEWQRFEHTSTGTFPRVLCDDAATIYVWGAQLEGGDYATSYIPTSGSTVTRSADVANNSGNADLFNDSEGVLYAEIAALADDGTARRMSISDSTTSNRVVLMYHSTSNVVRSFVSSSGILVSDMTYTVSDTTQVSKIAFSYKQNDFKLWIDGVQRTTDDSGATPTGLKELAFDGGSGSNNFYGDVKCVAVFKEALSNDELELLTGEGYNSFATLAAAYNYNVI